MMDEDVLFREYLVAHGVDISNMGNGEAVRSCVADRGELGGGEK